MRASSAECDKWRAWKPSNDAYIEKLEADLSQLRAENLSLGVGEYLLNEIGAALNCAPDATILQRIAELEQGLKFQTFWHNEYREKLYSIGKRIAELEAAIDKAAEQIENGDLNVVHSILQQAYAAHPAPQAEQERTP